MSSKYGTRCQTIMAVVISIVNFITRVKIHFDASAGFLLLYQHMQLYICLSISIRVSVTLEPRIRVVSVLFPFGQVVSARVVSARFLNLW